MLCTLRSDKLAKWCLLGVQGALLSTLLEEPLYLESLTVALSPYEGTLAQAAFAALQRAVAGESTCNNAPSTLRGCIALPNHCSAWGRCSLSTCCRQDRSGVRGPSCSLQKGNASAAPDCASTASACGAAAAYHAARRALWHLR